ncbi:MAG: imelysin family protein [Polyangiaceae bacterium]|nr:imelysin family protein [Polyangiaceae bacterium]MCW5792262.1 imelysin family protein [Polyangiaceae bacterium]
MKRTYWTGLLIALVSFGGCRKEAPDEVVFTGKTTGPSSGGSGASGGTSWFGGSSGGGAGGASGSAGTGDAGTDADTPDLVSCGFPEETQEAFTKSKLLRAVAECAVGRYAAFQVQAEALSTEAQAFEQSPSSEALARTQLAWQRAISAWQEAEPFRFGPAARPAEPGGQDHRDQIYGWPLASRCRIEEQIVSQLYLEPRFVTSLINGRTLSSLDYLLFYGGTSNGCSAFSSINASGTWDALGADEIRARRVVYASRAASLVAERARALVTSWVPASEAHPDGANFCGELSRAGAGSAVFASDQAALNAVSDGMFYVEKELKDWKLGRPIGYGDCFSASCPESVELPFSRGSVAHMQANLRGFRRLFQGCGPGGEGVGFDDWLIAIGAGDLAARMLSALDGAEPAIAAIGGPLDDAVVNEPEKVQLAYTRLKALTDLLKTEFVSVLNLELPKTSEGDND